jgi:two-component system NtrC family response regulator
VRQLLNVIKRAAIMAEGNRVGCDDLGLPPPAAPDANDADTLDLRTVRERAERSAVIAALARTNDNIAKAAELLGVSRPTLYDLLNRLAIKT